MSHEAHAAGTDNECVDYLAVAYEPSWYAAPMAFDGVTIVEGNRVGAGV